MQSRVDTKLKIIKNINIMQQPETIPVAGGTFTMGEGRQQHKVTLSDFEIGKYPVTVGEYLQFCDETESHYPEWLELGSEYNIETGTINYYSRAGISRKNTNRPITGISWFDAVAYCEWLSAKTGPNYRLPTEAEWEYAARGGNQSKGFKFAGSDNLDEVGWYEKNSNDQTHPVGLKKPNELGLYDMSGNVWEWCRDWYDEYPTEPQTNPQGPEFGSYRVLRGGSWHNYAILERVAARNLSTPSYRSNFIGFRLSRTL